MWRHLAACKGMDIGIFFPREDDEGPSARRLNAVARAVCARCPVQLPCAQHALASEEYGTWGGMTAYQRRQRTTVKRTRSSREEPGRACG